MKHLNLMLMFFLSGCGNDWMWIPDRQDIKFKCDMDPYRQGCERRIDYQEHYKLIQKPQR
ncbi:Uncharacterised protein [Pseudomonas putida]|uniref:Lipoprotein n=1 Tax=Pseudomonas guariconensis TaxID=1288410 RepID=A0AAX0VZI9_9PSED|nr:hypothetical protein CXG49_09580 [Pseudomonas guariconensis]CAB5525157.1 Uncharacterised protein [Pseudomonas putida]PLV24091.1 hypothetical protein CXG53_11860 [Pseudomonas guariconensis]PLV29112.1 hypothetical protein CXG51_12330 [Pseudomonas guariconensis]CAB5526558.1 Uncharacterised protein [Pseudomonas putida]